MFERQISFTHKKIAHSSDNILFRITRGQTFVVYNIILLLYLGHDLTFIRNLGVHFWDGPRINAYIISFGATQQVLKGFPTPPCVHHTPESVINSQVKETIWTAFVISNVCTVKVNYPKYKLCDIAPTFLNS